MPRALERIQSEVKAEIEGGGGVRHRGPLSGGESGDEDVYA